MFSADDLKNKFDEIVSSDGFTHSLEILKEKLSFLETLDFSKTGISSLLQNEEVPVNEAWGIGALVVVTILTLAWYSQGSSIWKYSIFGLIPKAVFYTVVALPFAIVYLLYNYAGVEAAAVSCAGALFYMYMNMLTVKKQTKYGCKKVTFDGASPKKRVVVIGCGPSGTVTAKELIEEGHNVTLYDMNDSVGGVFAHTFWEGGFLTSSPYVTAFGDFEPQKCKETGKERLNHFSAKEYVQYLNDYVDHYGVRDSLHFNTRVLEVTPRTNEAGVQQFYVKTENIKDKTVKTDGPFDNVAVATGSFSKKFVPNVPGLDTFKGKILHSTDFAQHGFDGVAGKNVVSIGIGESMADILGIMHRIPNPPKSCYASVREGAFVIPRVNPLNGKTNDMDSTRIRYSLPHHLHNLSFYYCGCLSQLGNSDKASNARHELFRKIRNKGPGFVKTTKSDDFVKPIVEGKLKMKPGIKRIEGSTVHFMDGSTAENIDVLALGTGFYPPTFPFLGPSMKHVCCATERYLRTIDPNLGPQVGFIGLGIRPLIGSIPTIAEMQARFYAQVVSEKLVLPSKEAMMARAEVDKAFAKSNFQPYNSAWAGLTHWIIFMDSLAKEIGCLPKRYWLLTHPSIAIKLLFGAMCTFHYRLTGPGAKPELAKDVISRMPMSSRKRDLIWYIAIHASTGLLTWPLFVLKLFWNSIF